MDLFNETNCERLILLAIPIHAVGALPISQSLQAGLQVLGVSARERVGESLIANFFVDGSRVSLNFCQKDNRPNHVSNAFGEIGLDRREIRSIVVLLLNLDIGGAKGVMKLVATLNDMFIRSKLEEVRLDLAVKFSPKVILRILFSVELQETLNPLPLT